MREPLPALVIRASGWGEFLRLTLARGPCDDQQTRQRQRAGLRLGKRRCTWQARRFDDSSARLPDGERLKGWHREYAQRLDLPAGYVRQPMYSQAQKDRAVEHYLEHSRCIAATIKSLGYPSRDLLSAWIEHVHPQGRARVTGRVRELAPQAKQSTVIALCMRRASAQAVADDVGVSRGSLYKWKNQLLGHDAPAPMKRQQDAPATSDQAELEQQLQTLRRDVRRLQLEKDC